jgi:ABC-type multidrug transport system fused ATPase/permease subunit
MHRENELKQLAIRKYLDALCVCTWALTTSLFAASTFGLMSWWGQPLSPATVIVCLSLFSILINPLNSLPWVLNGVVEAWVSADRLAAFLSPRRDATSNGALQYKARGVVRAVATRSHSHKPPPSTDPAQPGDDESSMISDIHSFGWDAVLSEFEDACMPGGGDGACMSEPVHSVCGVAVQMKSASFSWAPPDDVGGWRIGGDTLRSLSFSVPKVCGRAKSSCSACSLHA